MRSSTKVLSSCTPTLCRNTRSSDGRSGLCPGRRSGTYPYPPDGRRGLFDHVLRESPHTHARRPGIGLAPAAGGVGCRVLLGEGRASVARSSCLLVRASDVRLNGSTWPTGDDASSAITCGGCSSMADEPSLDLPTPESLSGWTMTDPILIVSFPRNANHTVTTSSDLLRHSSAMTRPDTAAEAGRRGFSCTAVGIRRPRPT